jgi:hypothetical protein
MAKLFGACVGVAALSLLLPSQPTFDPWAWLVWGREVAFLDLDTTSGPSWKPLPVAFTVVYAPLGKIGDGVPGAVWIVTARAFGLLALALAAKVAARLAGPRRRAQMVAGGVAALAFVLTPQWLRYMAHGNEPPMALAFLLLAIDRHLDGRRDHAAIALFLACLLRPEIFPFLAAYAAYAWRADPDVRRLIVGLFVGLPLLWLGPEWIGSGDPLSAGDQARSEPPWSLSLREQPWLEALRRGDRLVGLPLELGALVAVGFAVRTRERVVLALAAAAVLWLAMIAVMTEAGFSGNSRYFLPALVLVCVLAGVGAANLVTLPRPVWAQAAAGIAIAVLVFPYVRDREEGLEAQARNARKRADLHRDLHRAVERLGVDAVVRRGGPNVNRGFVTRMAWELKLPLRDIRAGRGRGFTFYARAPASGIPPTLPAGRGRPVARIGPWAVYPPASAPTASTGP